MRRVGRFDSERDGHEHGDASPAVPVRALPPVACEVLPPSAVVPQQSRALVLGSDVSPAGPRAGWRHLGYYSCIAGASAL